jgi:hypothetical protein
MALDVFRNLGPINIPNIIVCMDRRINYMYGSSDRSEFIYTETQGPFIYEALKKTVGCRNAFDSWSGYIGLDTEVLRFAM